MAAAGRKDSLAASEAAAVVGLPDEMASPAVAAVAVAAVAVVAGAVEVAVPVVAAAVAVAVAVVAAAVVVAVAVVAVAAAEVVPAAAVASAAASAAVAEGNRAKQTVWASEEVALDIDAGRASLSTKTAPLLLCSWGRSPSCCCLQRAFASRSSLLFPVCWQKFAIDYLKQEYSTWQLVAW